VLVEEYTFFKKQKFKKQTNVFDVEVVRMGNPLVVTEFETPDKLVFLDREKVQVYSDYIGYERNLKSS
jgi:hypothetical protein